MDKFIEKTVEELDAMTAEQAQLYMTEKQAHEKAEIKRLVDEGAEANVEAIGELKSAIQETTDKLFEMVKVQGETLSNQTRVMSNRSTDKTSYEQEMLRCMKDNQGEIEAIYKAKSGRIEMKVVGDITTASGTLATPLPPVVGTDIAPLTPVNLRSAFILALTNNMNTDTETFTYTEASPKDGDFGYIAEGDTKVQMDFDWITRTASTVELAAWERLSNQSIKDIANLQSVATGYLKSKHDLKKQNAILFGTGVAPQPEGATVAGRVFAAGAMLNKVVNPNIMDVINACITDIYVTPNFVDEVPFIPNLVLLNPNDFYLEFVAPKNADGNPLFPTASLFNTVTIGGVTIIPELTIPAGQIFVGDMKKYNTTNYVPYTVTLGWVNDDFIKNQFVMLGESRFHAFTKNFDKAGMIYDTIATIKAAIIAP